MKVQVLGMGSKSYKDLYKAVEKIAKRVDAAIEVEYSTDPAEIIKTGPINSPILVIDGVRQSEGKVLTDSEIEAHLTKNRSRSADVRVVWQRLLVEGETCPRCGLTEEFLSEAVEQLKQVATPLGKSVSFSKKEMALEEFGNQVYRKSNEIVINEKTLEDWLGASKGMSQCEGVCGDNDCVTFELDGQTYEAIPKELIVKAGLMAITELKVQPADSGNSCGSSC